MSKQPVNTEHLDTLIHSGRSVIFVPSDVHSVVLEDALKRKGMPVLSHVGVPLEVLKNWNFSDEFKPRGVLLVVVPAFATGVRLTADRVIWLGRVPEDSYDSLWAIYEQSMARCDRTNKFAARYTMPLSTVFN